MELLIHRAEDRGFADHGWLKAIHSFSFASYYDPVKVHFGALRVLNDDTISGGQGFGTHPHDNMEIITIPFSGALEHRDSMGNHGVIKEGEIQVMSAGTGIQHSEFNHLEDKEVKLFQIWILPKTKGVTPRYDQITINDLKKDNTLYQIISPDQNDEGSWIHQDAWFHMANCSEETELEYKIKKDTNGIYLMLIEGEVHIGEHKLQKRDAVGITGTENINFRASKGSSLLLMDLPLTW